MGDLRDDFPYLDKGIANIFLEFVNNNIFSFLDLPTHKELTD